MATRNVSEQVRSLTKKPFSSSLVHEEIRRRIETERNLQEKVALETCTYIFFLINVSFLSRYYG